MVVDVRCDQFKYPLLFERELLTCDHLMWLLNMAKSDMLRHIRWEYTSDGIQTVYNAWQRRCDHVQARIAECLVPHTRCMEMANDDERKQLLVLIDDVFLCGSMAVDIEIMHVLQHSTDAVAIFYGGVRHAMVTAKYLMTGVVDGQGYTTVFRDRKERRQSM